MRKPGNLLNYNMKRSALFFCFFFLIISVAFISPDFITDQKKFERVRTAYKEKEPVLTEKLKQLKLDLKDLNVLFIAYKNELQMDVYVKRKSDMKYSFFGTYTICASSGGPGPKRRLGDNQVPEGFYYIDRFNPSSSYYLSLGLNYPNTSDRIKSKGENPGGDIFIHGECATIGCMPMTNDPIKELYVLAIQARQAGQVKVPVYSFPFRFTEANFSAFKENYKTDTALIEFWTRLKVGYDKFQNTKEEVKFRVDNAGNYFY
jgi:murein L,D-transpeptidase YafK